MTGDAAEPARTSRGGDVAHELDEDDFDAVDDFDDFDDPDDGEEPGERAAPAARNPRLIAGIVCVVAGIIVAVLAVRAVSSDDTASSDPKGTDTAQTTSSGDDAATTQAAGWPASVQGRPAALGTEGGPPASAEGVAPGWYLWSDFKDWHLWLVGGEGTETSAVITTNDKLTVKNTYGDAAVEPTTSSAAVRRGEGTAPIAGIDFNPGFYGDELTVTVTGDLPLRTGQQSTEASSPLVLTYNGAG